MLTEIKISITTTRIKKIIIENQISMSAFYKLAKTPSKNRINTLFFSPFFNKFCCFQFLYDADKNRAHGSPKGISVA